MNKNIIKLLSKGIDHAHFNDPQLIEWSKNENNNRLIQLLTHFFTQSKSQNEQIATNTNELRNELLKKIAIQESQEKIYTKKTLKGILIGIGSAAAVASILLINSNSNDKVENEFRHNISVMYNNQSATILSDGTKVILRPGSNLSYDEFDDSDKRVVKLDGEAYFDVAKANKEFIVIAGDSKIKVLGTKFNVKANEYDNYVETILLSGSVEFQYTDSISHDKSIIMTPNEQLIFDKQTKHCSLSENRKPLEYITNDEYKFDNVPLSKVFEVIGDIYELEIIIDNKEIEDIRYTGVLRRSHSFDSTMKILSEVVSLKYYKGKNGIIITTR